MKKIIQKAWIISYALLFLGGWLSAQPLFEDVTGSTQLAINLVAGRGASAFGDYDNDGHYDLFYSGDKAGVAFSAFYHYDSSVGSWEDATSRAFPSGLLQIRVGQASWVDYNNDGLLDLVISGFTATSTYYGTFKVYKNIGDNNADGIYEFEDATTSTGIDFASSSLNGAYAPYLGSIEWADYDKDGDLDLLINGKLYGAKTAPYGYQSSDVGYTRLYKNLGNGTFTVQTGNVNAGNFTGISGGFAKFGDYNHDGWPDVFVSGYPGVSQYYLNLKDGTFSAGTTFTTLARGATSAFADYNNDGYVDFLYSIATNQGTAKNTPYFQIYQGASAGGFASDANFVPGITLDPGNSGRSANLSWGDFDNDGDLDFVAQGENSGTAVTRIFRNNYKNPFTTGYTFTDTTSKTGVFSTVPAGLTDNYAQWLDYDQDGYLDLFLAGSTSILSTTSIATTNGVGKAYLFRNKGASLSTPIAANTKPSKPGNLKSTTDYPYVILNWDEASDDHSTKNGITYEIRVGKTQGGSEIVAPFSNPSTGFARVPKEGPIREIDRAASYILKNLPAGTYYWSVHAIDGAYAGGEWSTEKSFTVVETKTTTPVAQVTSLKSNVTSQQSIQVSWINSDSRSVAIFVKDGSDGNEVPLITDNKKYKPNSTYSKGDSIFSADGKYWYNVYSGAITSNGDINYATIIGLKPTHQYQVAAVAYNHSYDSTSVLYNHNFSNANLAVLTTADYSVPKTPANSLAVNTITDTSVLFTFTTDGAASDAYGNDHIIFVKKGKSATDSALPLNNHSYIGNVRFGQGTQILDAAGIETGWFSVLTSADRPTSYYSTKGAYKTTIPIQGLIPGNNYQVTVLPYNGGSLSIGTSGWEKYLTDVSAATKNPIVFSTQFPIPTSQASELQVDKSASQTELSLKWKAGKGSSGRVVFSAPASVTSVPTVTNQTYYGVSTSDNSGAWTVIYNGSDTSFLYSGLTANTAYKIAVYEYNADVESPSGTERYLSTVTANENLGTFTTVDISNGVAAMNLIASSITDTSAVLNWYSGTSNSRLLLVTSNLAATDPKIADGTSFYVGKSYGDWTALYKGTASTIQVKTLIQNTTYKFVVASYYGDSLVESYLNDYSGTNITTATTLAGAPKIQVTKAGLLLASSKYITEKWHAGTGQKSVAFINTSLSDAAPVLANGISYPVGTSIGNWVSVYNGADTIAKITSAEYPSITSNTQYQLVVYSYNENIGLGAGNELLYHSKVSSQNRDTIATTSVVTAPATTASSSTFTRTENTLKISWANGSGSKRVVLLKKGSTPRGAISVPTLPVLTNDVTYQASTNAKIPASSISDWNVIYNGNSTSVTVTGLTANTNYYAAIFEYNGEAGDEKYGTGVGSGDSTKLRIPVITLASAITISYGAENIAPATSSVAAPEIVYASTSTAVAAYDIANKNVDIVGAGLTTITASQAATDTSKAASASSKLRVKTAPFTFKPVVADLGTNKVLSVFTSTGTSATFTVGNTAYATVDVNTLKPVAVGQTTINAAGSANDTTITVPLYVRSVETVLGFGIPLVKKVGDDPFSITDIVKTSSANGVTFTSSNTNVVTVDGTTITIVGVGTADIIATQKGDLTIADAIKSASITINKGTASVSIADLATVYDGSAKAISFAITPASAANANVVLTYNGSTVAPIAAGSYDVIATIVDPNYEEASFTAKLTINKAPVEFTASNLSQVYDGSVKSISVSSTPADVAYSVTYLQGGIVVSEPINKGSYDVAITSSNLNYSGSKTATLEVTNSVATISLANLSTVYTGLAQLATASTIPANLSTAITYDGASTLPVNAGSYKVETKVVDENYGGSASGSLVIAKAPLTVKAIGDTINTASDLASYTFTYAITGFVNGETDAVVTGEPIVTTTAKSTSKKGSYDINVVLGSLTASNYSFDTFTKGTLVVSGNVGVESAVADGIVVYPNPVTYGSVTIKGQTEGSTLKVISINGGSVILEKKLNNGSEKIDLGTIPAGVYLFQVISSEKVITIPIHKI